MTFMKSDALIARSGRPTSGRIALALSHAISDSQTRPRVVPFGSGKRGGRAFQDYFNTLLEQEGCEEAWTAYTDVTTTTAFPQQLAKGSTPLNGFRHYTLQDAIYLEYYVRVRMEAIGTWDSNVSSADLRIFVATIPSSLDYSTSTRSVCENQLGIPESVIDDEWNNGRSTELETSIRNYETVIKNAISAGDSSWLDIHFALLPCIKGYYVIAKALLQDPTTIRNTLYYSLWIEENADGSYAEEYDTFIENNIPDEPTDEQWAHWGEIFRQACDNERNFFNLAIADFPKYDILTEGNYTISPYTNSSGFLAPDDQGGVTVSTSSTQWQLINYTDGYSIKYADQQFLGVDDSHQVVIKSDETTKWSINPIYIPDFNTYQFFLTGEVQLALDAASDDTVSVANNNATTQTWLLTQV